MAFHADMTFTAQMLSALFALAIVTVSSGAPQAVRHGRVIFSQTFSEEPRSTGNSGVHTSPIVGIKCSRSYCDDKQLILGAEGGIVGTSLAHKTRRFSEARGGHARCPTGMVVNSIFCFGSYCNDMILACDRIVAPGYTVSRTNFHESRRFSEEQKEGRCRDGFYLRGIKCFGSYCDDLVLDCVQITRETSLGNWMTALENDFEKVETGFSQVGSEVVDGLISAMECSHSDRRSSCPSQKLIYHTAQCGASHGGDSVFIARSGNHVYCRTLPIYVIEPDSGQLETCQCGPDQLMVGIGCSGRHCGPSVIRCMSLTEGFRINHSNAKSYNEVINGVARCPSGMYAWGVFFSTISTALDCVEVLWLAKP